MTFNGGLPISRVVPLDQLLPLRYIDLPKRTQKDPKGTQKDPKGTQKDPKGINVNDFIKILYLFQ